MRRVRMLFLVALALGGSAAWLSAQTPSGPTSAWLLVPDRVFDGTAVHSGWSVLVRGNRIEAAGPSAGISPNGAETIRLAGQTLLPGLIEGHSHLLLHPYNET
jgi:imidazolonepropionase-like amidohydrolase